MHAATNAGRYPLWDGTPAEVVTWTAHRHVVIQTTCLCAKISGMYRKFIRASRIVVNDIPLFTSKYQSSLFFVLVLYENRRKKINPPLAVVVVQAKVPQHDQQECHSSSSESFGPVVESKPCQHLVVLDTPASQHPVD
jgi:hypothetical protein